jgi:hypothetical protein
LQLSHPHPAAGLDADAEPDAHPAPWGYAAEDLPVVALVVRGSCVFTDKIRALQVWARSGRKEHNRKRGLGSRSSKR